MRERWRGRAKDRVGGKHEREGKEVKKDHETHQVFMITRTENFRINPVPEDENSQGNRCKMQSCIKKKSHFKRACKR